MDQSRASPAEVARLYRQYRTTIYRRALRMLGDKQEAEEAAQEVFVRVLDAGAAHKGTGNVSGWLWRITTHYCLNHIRDRRRRQELFQVQVAPSLGTTVSVPAESELAVRQVMRRADARQAEAAFHIFYSGLSHAEAAKELGVSVRTVGYLVQRLFSNF